MSSETSPRLSLDYVMPTQAQKHVTVNEAFRRLDALVQAVIVSRTVDTEPQSPQNGDAYILPLLRSGAAWAPMSENSIAVFQDTEWREISPRSGWRIWDRETETTLVFLGQHWAPLESLFDEFQNLTELGVGTTADASNPFSAKLNSSLWTARSTGEGGTGDFRLNLNKEGSGHVLSLVLQSGYTGRAEMGLLGEDAFQIKLSDDVGDWHSVFRATSDHVAIPAVNGMSTTAINGDAPGTRRNLLINGDFSIAQRGEIFNAPNNGDYTLDRWVHVFDGGMTHEISRQSFAPGQTEVAGDPDYFLRWSLTGLASGNPWIEQRIENARSLAEGEAVLSFHARSSRPVSLVTRLRRHFGTGGSATETLDQLTIDLTTAWVRTIRPVLVSSVTGKTFGNGDHLSVEFYILGGETDVDIEFANVQLERGMVATVFEKRKPAAALADCQRYFAKTWPREVVPGSVSNAGALCAFTNGASNAALFNWRVPVEMRAPPSVTIYSPATGAAGQIDAGGLDIAATPLSISRNAISIQSAPHSGAVTAQVQIVADAEL